MTGKQLKNSILQWAIQGKLVPQDPNDEPASVLLERIREEKARLVKEKKIKKDKNESIIYRGDDNSHYEKFTDGTVKCIDDEIPFEIPQSWCWVRLGQILTVKGGKRIPLGDTFAPGPTSHIYIRVTEMKNHTLVDNNLKYITDSVYEKIKNYTISKNDLYLTIAGTIGSVGVVPDMFDGMNLTENAVKLTNILVNKMFLVYGISSQFVQSQFVEKTKQMAQPKLAIERILTTLIPLPPSSEQECIVSKIEEIMPIVEKYNKSQDSLDRLNAEIFDRLKKSVLQEAIQGKLVPQSPDDEPASELLKRINPKAEITADNGQYGKVPEGWTIIGISQISELLSGRDLTNKDCNGNEEGIPYLIGASNIVNNQLNIIRWTNKPQVISIKGDILISCKGTIGEIVLNNIGDIHIARQFMAIRSNKDCIITEYFLYYLFAMVHNIKENARGVIPGISREDILTKCIPLPPLPEQRRIVDAIDKAFAKLDAIMESL